MKLRWLWDCLDWPVKHYTSSCSTRFFRVPGRDSRWWRASWKRNRRLVEPPTSMDWTGNMHGYL